MTWDPQVRAGFETRSAEEFIRLVITSGDPSISSTKARTGTYSLRLVSSSKAGFAWATPANRVQVGAAFNHAGVLGSNNGAVLFDLRAANGDPVARVRWNNTGSVLELHVDGVLQDSEDATVSGFAGQDVWHEVGMQVNIANDANGFVSVYINGIKRLEYSGAIDVGAAASLQVGGMSGNTSQWSNYLYVEDVMLDTSTINETDAAPPNIRLDYRAITADLGTPAWTPVGAANNWDAVNDAPNDADATYVWTDTDNDRDLYTFPVYNAPTGYIIEAVIPVFVARKTAASSAMQIEPVINDGTAIGVAAALDLPSTYGYVWRRYAAKPSGGAWGTTVASGVAIGMDAVVPA